MAPEPGGSHVPIIDIRQKKLESSLVDEIGSCLRQKEDFERTLPTLLLYDEIGLKLFEEITYLDEYYPTNAEIEVLTLHASSIAKEIQAGSLIVELGSGYAPMFLPAKNVETTNSASVRISNDVSILTQMPATSVRSKFYWKRLRKLDRTSTIMHWMSLCRSFSVPLLIFQRTHSSTYVAVGFLGATRTVWNGSSSRKFAIDPSVSCRWVQALGTSVAKKPRFS